MTNENEWKPIPEREDTWITDYAFEATVESADDVESHDYTVQVVELQNVHKIVAEATKRGEVKALTALAQKISAMTMKDPGGLSENASHEDYFDNGHTVGVNMACMYVIREIDAKLTSLKNI